MITTARRDALAADFVLLAITLAWGGTFVAVKEAVERTGVFAFLALRFSLAAVTLAVALGVARTRQWRGPRDGTTRVTRPLSGAATAGLGTGLALFAGYALQTMGLQHTSAGKAGFITGMSVVLVPIIDAAVFHRPQERSALAGVSMAALGIAGLFLEPADLQVRQGDLLVLVCAVAFAVHVTLVSRLGQRLEPLHFTLWQVVAVVALSAPAAAWGDGWRGSGLDAPVVGALLLTGPVVSGVLLLAQVWAQRRTSATHAAIIFSLEPVFAALAGYVLAGEHLGLRAMAGAALILAGTVTAEAGRYRESSPETVPQGASRPA